MNSSDKATKISNAIDEITRKYGAGAVSVRGAYGGTEFEMLSTGVDGLDGATGGGWPRGRVTEVTGELEVVWRHVVGPAVTTAVRAGRCAALVDVRHAFVPDHLDQEVVGSILVAQPDSGEQALEIAHDLARSGAVDLLVIDNTNGLTPADVLEGERDPHGLQARLLSMSLRKITAVAARNNAAVVFLSAPLPPASFLNPRGVGLGNALKFYASLRVEVKSGEEGVIAKVVKNKLAPPFQWATIGAPETI